MVNGMGKLQITWTMDRNKKKAQDRVAWRGIVSGLCFLRNQRHRRTFAVFFSSKIIM